MDSIKGILVGIVLFVVAFPVLFMNEGCAVKTYKSLKEGKGGCVALAEPKVDAANDQKMVHFSGDAVTKEVVKDAELGISETAISLQRKVEVFLWDEIEKSTSKKKVGGSKDTKKTYTYKKVWTDSPDSSEYDSSKFQESQRQKHQNKIALPYRSNTMLATNVTAGEFNLNPSLVGKIQGAKPVKLDAAKLPEAVRSEGKLKGNVFYVGTNIGDPQIGDMKISFAAVPSGQKISVYAQQTGKSLQPYQTEAGDALQRLQMGTHSKEAMFEAAEAENAMKTWIIRLVGFLMMGIGLCLVFKPMSVLADVLPILGSFVGGAFGLIAFAIAFACSTITIAVAWIFYRPLLGVPLLLLGLGVIGFVIFKMVSGKKKAVTA